MQDKIIRATSFLDLIEREIPRETSWISKGLLPKGGILLFGGQSKAGKSFLMLELARALTTGTVPLGHPQLEALPPCRVLLIEQEVGETGLQKRLQAIFKDENPLDFGPNAFYASKIPEMQLQRREGMKILHDLVEQIQPNVLLLDPVGRMFSGDENKSDEVQGLFTFLDKMLKMYEGNGMSIVLSHHFKKPNKDDDPLDMYNFRGSGKWPACPDTLLTVQRLGRLYRPWKAWELKLRFETRQDEPPEEAIVSVNAEQDLRVRYVRLVHAKPPEIERTVRAKMFKGVEDD